MFNTIKNYRLRKSYIRSDAYLDHLQNSLDRIRLQHADNNAMQLAMDRQQVFLDQDRKDNDRKLATV